MAHSTELELMAGKDRHLTEATAEVAMLIRGSATAASVSVRAMSVSPGRSTMNTYFLLGDENPAETWNRAIAIRTEPWVGLIEAGSIPSTIHWLDKLLAVAQVAEIKVVLAGSGSDSSWPFPCMIIRREAFDELGGFDANRFPKVGYQTDFISRVMGRGWSVIQAAEVEFLNSEPHNSAAKGLPI